MRGLDDKQAGLIGGMLMFDVNVDKQEGSKLMVDIVDSFRQMSVSNV